LQSVGVRISFSNFVDFIDSNYLAKWKGSIDGTSINRVLIIHVTLGNVHESLRSTAYAASNKTAFDLTSPFSLPAATSATWNSGLISSIRSRSTSLRDPLLEPIHAWDDSRNSYRRCQIQISFPPGQPSSSGWRSLIGNSRSVGQWSEYVWSQVVDGGFIIFMKSGNRMTLSFGTPYHAELHDLIEEFGVGRGSPGCYLERPLPSITSTSGHVYVLEHPYDKQWLKVGKAGPIKSRLSSYNTGSPVKYSMPYIKPTNNQDDAETAVHDALVATGIVRRPGTEWFQTDLATAIQCIDSQVDNNWPSTKPSFSLGTSTSRTKTSVIWPIICVLGGLLLLNQLNII